MTQNTPPYTGQPGYSIQPTGSNGLAVASLVCSLLGLCVLFVGGIAGIILGVMGLKRANEVGSGKGMATAGIVVGIVSILTSLLLALMGAGGYVGYKTVKGMTDAPRTIARMYVTDLSVGNVDHALMATSGISREEVAAESASLSKMGGLKDMTANNFNLNNSVYTESGTLEYVNGTRTFTITLAGSGNSWKITSASFP